MTDVLAQPGDFHMVRFRAFPFCASADRQGEVTVVSTEAAVDESLLLLETDEFFIFCNPVTLGQGQKIYGLKQIRLALGIPADEDIELRMEFKIQRFIVSEISQMYLFQDHFGYSIL